MRILHTSDWHIGRTFHKMSTLDALAQVFDALVEAVDQQAIDVVVAAGDIFDTSTPSTDAVRLLDSVLVRLHDVGARVVLTSGNHDSPARLGARAAFAHAAGIHVLTDTAALAHPVDIDDAHGPVHFYGLPFIEPALQRHVWTEVESMRSQRDALGHALELVRQDWAQRGGRAVVVAHTFVAGAEGDSCDSERDIVGGVDKVPVSYFDGFTYAALGHIHGRATLSPTVRYSGAPLHYSFSEATKQRGGWIVDLGADGVDDVRWLDLPVPRPLSRMRGTIDHLLTSADYLDQQDHWISAVLTDEVRPVNAMRRLAQRFAHVVEISFEPLTVHQPAARMSDRPRTISDPELFDLFLTYVRNGHGLSDEESELVADVIASSADS